MSECLICGAEFKARGTRKTCGEACSKENTRRYQHDYQKRRHACPETRARLAAQRQAYKSRPEVKAHYNAHMREYRSRPEVKEAIKAKAKIYAATPEFKAMRRRRSRRYMASPEARERKRAKDRLRAQAKREQIKLSPPATKPPVAKRKATNATVKAKSLSKEQLKQLIVEAIERYEALRAEWLAGKAPTAGVSAAGNALALAIRKQYLTYFLTTDIRYRVDSTGELHREPITRGTHHHQREAKRPTA